MDKDRFSVTPDLLRVLRRGKIATGLLDALEALVGQEFEREEDFLRALYRLNPPPQSDAEAAHILRTADGRFQEALALLTVAYRQQTLGHLEEAIRLYRRSIALFPTAEGHTFLGWTYSFQNRYDEAVAECQKAIEVDPDFGNPYNDIGSYLIVMGRPREAIPWLERATQAKRYDPRHYPWANLGRAHEMLAEVDQALVCYLKADEIEPGYPPAREAIERLSPPPERMN
jgi:tetratricopeptide (TPR) repeat protein